MSDSSKYLESVLDSLSEPLILLNEKKDTVFANRAFVDLVGDSGKALGKITAKFWPTVKDVDLSLHEIASEFETARHGTVPVRLSISSLPDGHSLVRVLLADSSKFFHSQRLQTLGMLAGGVAHDFNNVLAGVLGHVTYLKTILPGSGKHIESLAAIEEGGKKASLLTQQILNFSKLGTADQAVQLDLKELLTKTFTLLRGALSPEYSLEFTGPDLPVIVWGVEGKLAQVIVNLVMNSRDATPPGGVIRIVLEFCSNSTELGRAFGPRTPDGGYAVLRVIDSGQGMSPELLTRVFEPYFSTKKEKGTGLGLATVDMIVRGLKGAIQIESTVGKGTTVSVFLPVPEKQERIVKVPKSAPALEGGKEKVLVVDDEDPVRNVLYMSLVHLGYNVEIAASGAEAIEKVTGQRKHYDLVILDMLMPNLSGDQVFFKLQERHKNINVLVISGYSSEGSVQRILDSGGKGFLQKPFTIEELAEKVRECLKV